jgi:hypothetical protein
MSQIELTTLKQGRQSKYVMSCSFFTMKESYRGFDKYRRALTSLLKFDIDPKYELRIYVDDSSKDDALVIVAKHNAHNPTVIHFNCPEFRDGDGHIGTFGTLVRFLPLFEKNEEVWITDIDIPSHYLSNPIGTSDIFIQTNICYDRKVYARKYTIVANRTIFRVSFPKSLLTRFIDKLAHSMTDIIQKLNDANTRKPSSTVPYGIDEVFMNREIYNSLQKKNVECTILKQYDAENFLNGIVNEKEKELLYENYLQPDSTTVRKVKKIYKEKLPLLVEKYPCLQEMIDSLDSFKSSMSKTIVINSSEL